MLQANLSNMRSELEKNNLLFTDLLIYETLTHLKEQDKELKQLINSNYESIHDLIKFTYFKTEDINIESLALVILAALSIGVLGKITRRELINIAYMDYITINQAKEHIYQMTL